MFPLWLVLTLASSAAAQVDVRLDFEPLQAEIGEPVELVLTAEHVPSLSFELPENVLPDGSWMLYEGAQKLTLPHPSREGMAVTVVRWSLASLDSGERSFEFPPLKWSDGETSGVAEILAPTLQVVAALAEGEDAPRAALVFREPSFPVPPIRRWPWVAGGGALLALLAWLLRRRRSATAVSREALSPMASLEALEARSGELGIRGTYFELSRLVRSALDEGGANLAGLTDEEWLAARELDVRSSPEEREALAALLARCTEVKYAQAEPTRWALDESLASAKALAQGALREKPEVAA